MWIIQKTFYVHLSKQSVLLLILTLSAVVLSSCAVKPIPSIGFIAFVDRLPYEKISLERDGINIDANVGTKLVAGDILSIGPSQSAILQLENGDVEVTLFENTRVRISSIIPDFGELAVKVLNKLKEAFKVESEFGIAASESTIYYVSVRKDEDMRVVGIEGAVKFTPIDNSGSVLLAPRDEVTWNNQVLDKNTVSRSTYNGLLEKINDVERIYKSSDARYIVPDVKGMWETNARTLIAELGLIIGNVEYKPTVSWQNNVVESQSLNSGVMVNPNSRINLTVSVEGFRVPNLVNKNSQDIIRRYPNYHFVLSSNEHGVIENHYPKAGNVVEKGTTITLDIKPRNSGY